MECVHMEKEKYIEIAKGKISEKRSVVISVRSQGGITVAQQLESQEGEKVTNVFLKGAFHIDDVSGLYNMRDAINAAIKVLEEGCMQHDDGNGTDWDTDEE